MGSPRRGHARALLLALCAGGLAVRAQRDTTRPTLTRARVALPGIAREYRLLHVSDLHGKRFGPRQERIRRLTAGRHYDAVVMTGDMVLELGHDREPVLELHDALRATADTFVFVRGNHDDHGVGPDLAAHGIVDVTRSFVRVGDLVVSDLAQAATAAHAHPGGLLVIAHHIPPRLSQLEALGHALGRPALVLAGHMHGGQVRVPGIGALLSPRPAPDRPPGVLPELRGTPTRGLHRRGNVALHISAGLGARGGPGMALDWGFRLGSRAELTELTIVPAEDAATR